MALTNPQGQNQYSYYRNDLLKAIDYASGAEAAYTYDAADRVRSITNRHNNAVVSSYGYDYDLNGNRALQTEENGFGVETTAYGYDASDRLTGVTYPDREEAYTHDGAWNRVTETVTGVADGTLLSDKTLTYNARHQLTHIDDSVAAANDATYEYDANGNQVERVQAGVTTTYQYDIRDNLRQVLADGTSLGQYAYDHQGLRTEKQTGQGTQRYTRDDQAVLFEADGGNTPIHRYDYGLQRLLSLKAPGQAAEFYLFDALTGPVTLLRKDGTITARYAYDAWGQKRHESGDSANPFGFTGHEQDEETDLLYARARYYDPATARFLSPDPWAGDAAMPPSLNKYLYAYQNPTVYVDPDGRFPVLRETPSQSAEFYLADGLFRYHCRYR